MPNKLRLRAHYNTIVLRAIQQVLRDHAGTTPRIVDHLHYGAVDIHPKNLAIWLMFRNSNDLAQATHEGYCERLTRDLKRTLAEHGYPLDAVSRVHIGFENKSEVDKVGAWNYFR